MSAPSLFPVGSEIFLVRGLLEPFLCQHVIQIAEVYQFETAEQAFSADKALSQGQDSLQLGDRDPLIQSTNQLLFTKIAIVQQLLYDTYGIKFPYAEPCLIWRYREGQFDRRHVDNILLSSRFEELEQGIPTRDISVIGYLNDDFEGGELYFDRQDVKIQPEVGTVLVFPAGFTHPHETLPIGRGQKYAFASWLYH